MHSKDICIFSVFSYVTAVVFYTMRVPIKHEKKREQSQRHDYMIVTCDLDLEGTGYFFETLFVGSVHGIDHS